MDSTQKNTLSEVLDLFEWACIDLPNGDYTLLLPDEKLLANLKADKKDKKRRDIFSKNLLSLLLEPMISDIHNSDIKFVSKGDKCNYYSLKNKFYTLEELINIKKVKEFETRKITNRKHLFFNLLDEKDRKKAVVKLTASILKHAEDSKNEELYHTLCSLLSNDAMTSLFIILFQDDGNRFSYFYEDEYNEWFQNKQKFKGEEAYKIYNEAMLSYPPNKNLLRLQMQIVKKNMKPVVYESIKEFYTQCIDFLPSRRASVAQNVNKLFAESELRVSAVLSYENSNENFPSSLTSLYKRTNLTKPLTCKLSDDSEELSTAFYYSVPYLILKSNALVYFPIVEHVKEFDAEEYDNENLVSLLTENKNIININRFLKL